MVSLEDLPRYNMQHIKDIFARINQNASKAKFYSHNQSVFLKHFESEEQYKALINAGNYAKIEENIKGRSDFKCEEFFKQINGG